MSTPDAGQADANAAPDARAAADAMAVVPYHANGAVAVAHDLTDASGVICSPTRFPDGVSRCLPETVQIDSGPFYADAACSDTERVAIIFPGLCDVPPTHVAYSEDVACEGPRVTSVHELRDALTGRVYGRYSGVCREAPGLATNLSLRRLGPALPSETFAPAAFEIE